MGTTLRDIIEEIGGGIPDGQAFKAVQTGGPSGGCIPEQHLDIAGGLRQLEDAGHDDGFRRHDRHGRDLLHGRCGALFHGVLHDRVVRQVHSVSRRHAANARFA